LIQGCLSIGGGAPTRRVCSLPGRSFRQCLVSSGSIQDSRRVPPALPGSRFWLCTVLRECEYLGSHLSYHFRLQGGCLVQPSPLPRTVPISHGRWPQEDGTTGARWRYFFLFGSQQVATEVHECIIDTQDIRSQDEPIRDFLEELPDVYGAPPELIPLRLPSVWGRPPRMPLAAYTVGILRRRLFWQ
jgi:hypothetical protein